MPINLLYNFKDASCGLLALVGEERYEERGENAYRERMASYGGDLGRGGRYNLI